MLATALQPKDVEGRHCADEVESAPIRQASSESLASPDNPPATKSRSGLTSASELLRTLSLAVAHNPDLVTLRQSERVGVATLDVANTYPFNPYVQVQATPYQELAGQGPGTTAHYVLLMQRMQLAHQQEFREEAATSSLNGIRWGINYAELQTASQAAQFYFTLLYQRGLLDIARVSHNNNEQLLDVATKRLAAGDTSAADVATVQMDTLSTEQQLRLADANYQSARRDLLRHLGLPMQIPTTFGGDLLQFRWRMPSPDLSVNERFPATNVSALEAEAWVASWATTRPDVMAAHANIDVAKANWRLASADRTPDMIAGPYYQRSPDGTTFLGLRAEMTIPVINSGRPLEYQRAAEFSQRTTLWQQTQLRAELEAQAALERYAVAYKALRQSSADQEKASRPALESLERQFRDGEIDVVRVIQARTSILQQQRSRLDLHNELAQAAAVFVGATGLPIELLIDQ